MAQAASVPMAPDTIRLYLDYLRVERRLGDQNVFDAVGLLRELQTFARSSERDACRYVGTVTGRIETLDANAISFFLGWYNHSEFHAIALRTLKEYYRFLLLTLRIDKDPMATLYWADDLVADARA